MDQATLESWHDFYLAMGTAAASLIGLLFVALSLNLDEVTAEPLDDLRAYAEQAFSSFTIVLLIAIFFLIPERGAQDLAVAYVVIGLGAAYRMLRRMPAIWRGRQHDRLGVAVLWRFALPAAAVIGLIVVGIGFQLEQRWALYGLVFVILALLMSAARSSWDLLVKVGYERRSAARAGEGADRR